ncbi:MAG: DUF1488 family protein [Bauldia sp.]|nr:DUF1488 family protein [Bauldia sp.]
MPAPALVLQTTYAELLERCASAAFSEDFPEEGNFIKKTVRGRSYWYFQLPSSKGRSQRYVGPETPELLERIARHKEARDDERERRSLVSTLVRSFGMSRPPPELANVVAALARAGVFRLRGVLVGTAAYQTYSAMLGVKLADQAARTGDIDIAQFRNVSVAVEDETPPMLDILKEVEPTFRPVSSLHPGRVASYQAKGGVRVDFLTPNEGPDTDVPEPLPSFRTDAQPLRFLDYLIHDPEPAVLLHGAGVYVLVPAPQRYAIHKLIVSRRRAVGAAKQDKDIRQAEALLRVLASTRPGELASAWTEAAGRGRTWRSLVAEGLGQIEADTRDLVLMAVRGLRNLLPGVDLAFRAPKPHYVSDRDVVAFEGETGGGVVLCEITGEALEDHFGAADSGKQARLDAFLKNRSTIEALARAKYLDRPIEEPGHILIGSLEIEQSGTGVRLRSGEAGPGNSRVAP